MVLLMPTDPSPGEYRVEPLEAELARAAGQAGVSVDEFTVRLIQDSFAEGRPFPGSPASLVLPRRIIDHPCEIVCFGMTFSTISWTGDLRFCRNIVS
jgi:hypothetical protein